MGVTKITVVVANEKRRAVERMLVLCPPPFTSSAANTNDESEDPSLDMPFSMRKMGLRAPVVAFSFLAFTSFLAL